MNTNNLSSFFLRIGLATVFLYAAIASFLDPNAWIGFFPFWVQKNLPARTLLFLFSTYEIVLALLLFSTWRTKMVATLAAVTLFLITIVNLRSLDIVFRDVAIFFSAVSLALIKRNDKKVNKK